MFSYERTLWMEITHLLPIFWLQSIIQQKYIYRAHGEKLDNFTSNLLKRYSQASSPLEW